MGILVKSPNKDWQLVVDLGYDSLEEGNKEKYEKYFNKVNEFLSEEIEYEGVSMRSFCCYKGPKDELKNLRKKILDTSPVKDIYIRKI